MTSLSTRLLGSLPAMRRDAVEELVRAWREQGDVARLRLGPVGLATWATLVVRPADVEHVLVRAAGNYQLSTAYSVLEGFLGDGLLTSHGTAWRDHRRAAQPAFTTAALARTVPHLVTAADAAAMRLAGRTGEVDLAAEMAALTLDGVGRALFAARLLPESAAVARALRTVQDFTLDAVYSAAPPALRPRLKDLPTPRARRYRAAVRDLDRVVAGLVAQARAGGADGSLLQLLDGGGELGDRHLRDQAMTFLLAGHETTASALTWTLALLSRHPDVRRRVVAELDGVLHGRLPEQADLADLPLLGATVQESLRLFPPAWVLERRAARDDVVGGTAVRAGEVVLLSPYLTHRHPDLWDDPEGFDPDRWLAPRARSVPRGAYLPFGAGARQCIGGAFATLEATLMLATLLPRVQVDLAPGQALRPVPRITLTAGAGLPVTVVARTPPAVPRPRDGQQAAAPAAG